MMKTMPVLPKPALPKKVMSGLVGVGVAALFMLGACTASGEAGPLAPAGRHPIKAVPYDITHGANLMTARLYPRLAASAGPNDNLFISPLSLSQGLGLAWLGARRETAREMREVLGWGDAANPGAITSAYNNFLVKTDDKDVSLGVANALWLAKGLPVSRAYLAATRSSYGAAPETLDFARAPGAAADAINLWVDRETKGRIDKIVTPDALTPDTAAILTNTLYFNGKWQYPFEDGTVRDFTRGDGTRRPIHMMDQVGRFQYRRTRELEAIALPYGGTGRFVMEVFLPRDAGTLRGIERGLKGGAFEGGEAEGGRLDLAAAPTRLVRIVLPRFEVRFDDSMKSALGAAGMRSAFSRASADFSGIAPGVPLAIDDVVHATYLRVDEEGTEAAAVTAVKIIVVGSRRYSDDMPQMIVDRPFLVAIRDRASGALLFFGRMADPAPVNGK